MRGQVQVLAALKVVVVLAAAQVLAVVVVVEDLVEDLALADHVVAFLARAVEVEEVVDLEDEPKKFDLTDISTKPLSPKKRPFTSSQITCSRILISPKNSRRPFLKKAIHCRPQFRIDQFHMCFVAPMS
jgi:hypothetical protein